MVITLSPKMGCPPQLVERKSPSTLQIMLPSVALRHTAGAPRGSGWFAECS